MESNIILVFIAVTRKIVAYAEQMQNLKEKKQKD